MKLTAMLGFQLVVFASLLNALTTLPRNGLIPWLHKLYAALVVVLITALLVQSTPAQSHPWVKPDTEAHELFVWGIPDPPMQGGRQKSAVFASVVPAPGVRPVSRDRDLAPYFAALSLATYFDLHYSRKAINAGAIEANPLLVQAARFAGDAGRDVASAALSTGFAFVVRQWVYERSPKAAKVAIGLFTTLRFGLAWRNRQNVIILQNR